MKTLSCVIAAALACAGPALGAYAAKPEDLGSSPVVSTQYGPIQGTYQASQDVYYFGSVPFAAPPVGSLRFMPPTAPTSWDTALNVSQPSPQCAEPSVWGILNHNATAGVEDCLYLDVYVPGIALRCAQGSDDDCVDVEAVNQAYGAPGGTQLPVMQWIYGGGYMTGSAWLDGKYNASQLAATRSVIVVAGNYRLGPLGWLALPELTAASDGMVGGAGLLDQRMAMQWTHANIAQFGGNSSAVTIFGQSAGAFSVCAHLVSPGSAGLFARAILESGNCESPAFFQNVTDAYAFGYTMAGIVGCGSSGNVLQCMQNAPVGSIMDYKLLPITPGSSTSIKTPPLYPIMAWGPVVDGTTKGLPGTPIKILQAGKQNQVPIIMGTVLNEGSVFSVLMPVIAPLASNSTSTRRGLRGLAAPHPLGLDLPWPPSGADVQYGCGKLFGIGPHGNPAEVNKPAIQGIIQNLTGPGGMYPVTTEPSMQNMDTVANLVTHFFFRCDTRRAMRAMLASGVNVWTYLFTLPVAGDVMYDLLGDYHSIEVGFVFGTSSHAEDGTQPTSAALQTWWTNFAFTGNPNNGQGPAGGATLPQWPQYNTASEEFMNITIPLTVENHLLDAVCDMWDSHESVLERPSCHNSAWC